MYDEGYGKSCLNPAYPQQHPPPSAATSGNIATNKKAELLIGIRPRIAGFSANFWWGDWIDPATPCAHAGALPGCATPRQEISKDSTPLVKRELLTVAKTGRKTTAVAKLESAESSGFLRDSKRVSQPQPALKLADHLLGCVRVNFLWPHARPDAAALVMAGQSMTTCSRRDRPAASDGRRLLHQREAA